MVKKGDLIKFRKFEYHTYKIYRVKWFNEKYIMLVPALNYINMGSIEIPIGMASCKQFFDVLTNEEIEEFERKEFEHACYQSCVDIDRLEEKLKKLDKRTDSHRINGEISSLLITINKRFQSIGGKNL